MNKQLQSDLHKLTADKATGAGTYNNPNLVQLTWGFPNFSNIITEKQSNQIITLRLNKENGILLTDSQS